MTKRSSKKRVEHILSHGRRWRQGPLKFMADQEKSKQSEIALLVPKKLFPRAVDRNRWRRMLRESLRQLSYRPNEDMIIMVGQYPLQGLKEPQVRDWLRQGLSPQ